MKGEHGQKVSATIFKLSTDAPRNLNMGLSFAAISVSVGIALLLHATLEVIKCGCMPELCCMARPHHA